MCNCNDGEYIISVYLEEDGKVLGCEEGCIIYDIYNLMSPNEWMLASKVGGVFYKRHRVTNELYEITIPF